LPFGNGDRSIQRVDGRRSDAFEHLIETRDLVPASLFISWRETVRGCDRGLSVIPREDLSSRGAM
jgi:hypothetical protein